MFKEYLCYIIPQYLALSDIRKNNLKVCTYSPK